jgi:hypothetical protein
MVVVRPVEPSVYERRRGPQNAGKARAAHDTVRRPVILEQGEGAVVQPSVIPELNADAEPFRDLLKEVGQPHVIDRGRRCVTCGIIEISKPNIEWCQFEERRGQPPAGRVDDSFLVALTPE